MLRSLLFLLPAFFLLGMAPVTISFVDTKTVVFKKELLEKGARQDMHWAWDNSVRCFPGYEQAKFGGNQVVYKIEMAPFQEITILLKPKKKKTRLNLYAYQVEQELSASAPDPQQIISCVADYIPEHKKRQKSKQKNSRMLKMLSLATPYILYIGVAGEQDIHSGVYKLEISSRKFGG